MEAAAGGRSAMRPSMGRPGLRQAPTPRGRPEVCPDQCAGPDTAASRSRSTIPTIRPRWSMTANTSVLNRSIVLRASPLKSSLRHQKGPWRIGSPTVTDPIAVAAALRRLQPRAFTQANHAMSVHNREPLAIELAHARQSKLRRIRPLTASRSGRITSWTLGPVCVGRPKQVHHLAAKRSSADQFPGREPKGLRRS